MGYGKADALLQEKWPDKYNRTGRPMWTGRVYAVAAGLLGQSSRVYHGTWCAAPFQSLYQARANSIWSLPLTPVWYLFALCFAALSLIGTVWTSALVALPFLGVTIGLSVTQAVSNALKARFPATHRPALTRWRLRIVTGLLHLIHPAARLWALLRWTNRGPRHRERRLAPLWRYQGALWTAQAQPLAGTLNAVATALHGAGERARRGGDYDRWDLSVDTPLASARLLMDVEEHGAGRRLVRFRVWPRWPLLGPLLILALVDLSTVAARDEAWAAATLLSAGALLLLNGVVRHAMSAMAALLGAIERTVAEPK